MQVCVCVRRWEAGLRYCSLGHGLSLSRSSPVRLGWWWAVESWCWDYRTSPYLDCVHVLKCQTWTAAWAASPVHTHSSVLLSQINIYHCGILPQRKTQRRPGPRLWTYFSLLHIDNLREFWRTKRFFSSSIPPPPPLPPTSVGDIRVGVDLGRMGARMIKQGVLCEIPK